MAIAHTFGTCRLGARGRGHEIVTINLADGRVTAEIRGPEDRATGGPVGVPLVVDVDGDGRDEAIVRIDTPEFTATDAYGNATTSTVSVMGGLDVRQLPCAAVPTVTFLGGAVITTVRGTRRSGPSALSQPATTGVSLPEIEETTTTTPGRD